MENKKDLIINHIRTKYPNIEVGILESITMDYINPYVIFELDFFKDSDSLICTQIDFQIEHTIVDYDIESIMLSFTGERYCDLAIYTYKHKNIDIESKKEQINNLKLDKVVNQIQPTNKPSLGECIKDGFVNSLFSSQYNALGALLYALQCSVEDYMESNNITKLHRTSIIIHNSNLDALQAVYGQNVNVKTATRKKDEDWLSVILRTIVKEIEYGTEYHCISNLYGSQLQYFSIERSISIENNSKEKECSEDLQCSVQNLINTIQSYRGEPILSFTGVTVNTESTPKESNSDLEDYNYVCARAKNIFIDKNSQYGNSWTQYRMKSITSKEYIKIQRIITIQENGEQAVEDSLEEDFLGILNYSLMYLITMESKGNNVQTKNISFEDILDLYDSFSEECRELFLKKNQDYGNIWRKLCVEYFADEILVKLERIISLESDVDNNKEEIKSNHLDIINYCIFAVILDSKKPNDLMYSTYP